MTAKRPTKDGFPVVLEAAWHDPENCPIDPVVKLALSDDPHEYEAALPLLRNMAEFKREEAGVFLIGLLMTCGDKWEKRTIVVRMLHAVKSDTCIDVLLGELRRVKSTNKTRRYLQEVIDALACMPPELVQSKLESLAEDVSLTPWVRTRLQVALVALRERALGDGFHTSSSVNVRDVPSGARNSPTTLGPLRTAS
jgi:hypothetical protein